MHVLAGRPDYRLADQAYFEILLRQCREHAWERRLRLLSYATAEDWRSHCARVRAAFRRAVGPFPERTPLNPRLVGTLDRDSYRVEKLLIESRPRYFVSANLYLPTKARSPAPAVVNPVGHWPNSKAETVVQTRGIGLARQGYVA